MRGTWVQSLAGDDSTCCGTTKPEHHNQPLNLCSGAQEPQLLKPAHSRASVPQQEKPRQREACTPHLESSALLATIRERPECSSEDSVQPKINKWKIKKKIIQLSWENVVPWLHVGTEANALWPLLDLALRASLSSCSFGPFKIN